MPLPIIAGLARMAAAAARAAPSIARSASGAARAMPVRSYSRAGFRGISHAAMAAAPNLESMAKFTGNVSKAADAVADMLGPVVKTGVAIATLPGKIAAYGDSLIAAQRNLAVYNGSMGMSQMRLEGERYRRDLRMGARTSESFGDLTKSQSRLEDKLLPFRAMMTNVENIAANRLNGLASTMIDIARTIPGVDPLLKRFGGDDKGMVLSLTAQMMNAIGRGDYSGRRMPVLGDPVSKKWPR